VLTTALRLLLGHQPGPFAFRKAVGHLPDFDVPNLGLYVHIPFCKTLCAFCPYFKVLYDAEQTRLLRAALLAEIDLVGRKCFPKKKAVTSVYYGGGSPALMADDLAAINHKIREHFTVTGHTGIELHPRDISAQVVAQIGDAGFDMVSLGVQSFSSQLLQNLGRTDEDPLASLQRLATAGLAALDVDLIFGIPGQTGADLRQDFLTAVAHGATQISTYPFIDFSYAHNRLKPPGHSAKRKLLQVLLETADTAGFVRNSVWTFARKDTPQYSSITRDNFIGFGPSATSLGRDNFKINTFSIEAYHQAIGQGIVPTALKLDFSARTRGLYWLFWNCYNGVICAAAYGKLFGRSLIEDFGGWLATATALRWLRRSADQWHLTARGSYLFHRVEQIYTLQYIDRVWTGAMQAPWPEEVLVY